MREPAVTISLVTWNSQEFIQECLKSVLAQTRRDFRLLIVDNASQDATVARIREEFPRLHILTHSTNLGFGRAHNHAIRLAKTPYVLVLNPDVILQGDFLERAIPYLEQRPHLGSVQGKLLRFRFAPEDDLRLPIRSDILDSTGLIGRRTFFVRDRGQGEQDVGQYDNAIEILGPTGACALYRREALQQSAIRNEYFDEDFFAYVEDVDLAWRLQLCGWESHFVPKAVAWHYRTVSAPKHSLHIGNARSRRPVHVRRLIAANALALLVKNLDAGTFFRSAPFIISREVGKFFWILFREPRVLPGYMRFFRLLPVMRRKRAVIQRHRNIAAGNIRRFFI